jgi:alpha-L-fucosidase
MRLLIQGCLFLTATLCPPAMQAGESQQGAVRIDPGDTMEDIVRKAASVTPHPRQLAWQRLEFQAFVHFGMNTFTDREWGDGKEDPRRFLPTALDAGQWVAAFRAAGMKGVILTAKHHDGFCLWPSRHTEHSVKNSPWKGGQGDVVREVSDACRTAGLKFGIYLSPWDRHERSYGDSPRYNEYFRKQLAELLSGYGEISEVWFDGACGEGPNGKRQVYDWSSYYEVVRRLQPKAVISVVGPDVRWCGNEAGRTRESEWSVLPARNAPEGHRGDPAFRRLLVNGQAADLGSRERLRGAEQLIWLPAQVNTSIRPGWFYHPSQDGRVKSLKHLLDIYYGSVGGNAQFLLNVPPDTRGLVHENDAARLRELGSVLRATFRTNLAAGARVTASEQLDADRFPPQAIVDGNSDTCWRPKDGTEAAWLEIDLGEKRTFNRAMLAECLGVGQRVERFALDVRDGGDWRQVAGATVIGYKRLLRFPAVTSSKVRVRFLESRVCPTLSRFGLFREPPRPDQK